MNLVEEVKYIMANVAGNNNKFWYGYRYDNHLVRSENGRVGTTGDSHEFPQDSEDAAKKFLAKKCREKEKKGYKKLEVVNSGSPKSPTITVSQSQSVNLAEVAKKQIQSNSPETFKLIERLSKANIHSILSSTTMTYNVATGLFSTPCGIVNQDTIDKARDLLKDLGAYVIKSDLRNPKYIKLLEEYLMLIPQKVGRKLDPESLYTTKQDVQKQNDILDSLTASLQSVLSTPLVESEENKSSEPKIFSVKLLQVDDDKIIKRLKTKFKSTMNKTHECAHLDVKNVYSVEIESMHAAFEKKGRPIGNIQEYWHGTRISNVLSILKGGLVIPKSSASHCSGRMFGDGIYFSDQSTKSLNYSYGFWDGKKRDENCFMFTADVAMGKSYTPRGSYESLPKAGYDSSFAKAGESGVRNNEMIVYNLYQCNLTYLIEFSPGGK